MYVCGPDNVIADVLSRIKESNQKQVEYCSMSAEVKLDIELMHKETITVLGCKGEAGKTQKLANTTAIEGLIFVKGNLLTPKSEIRLYIPKKLKP